MAAFAAFAAHLVRLAPSPRPLEPLLVAGAFSVLAVTATRHLLWFGAQGVVEAFEAELGIRAGETSPDGAFTLLAVECYGGCGWGPVVSVDHRYREPVRPEDVRAIVRELRGA